MFDVLVFGDGDGRKSQRVVGQLKEAAACQTGSGARFGGVLHSRKRTRRQRWGNFVASVVSSEEFI